PQRGEDKVIPEITERRNDPERDRGDSRTAMALDADEVKRRPREHSKNGVENLSRDFIEHVRGDPLHRERRCPRRILVHRNKKPSGEEKRENSRDREVKKAPERRLFTEKAGE